MRKLRKAATREREPYFFEFIRPYEGEWDRIWCCDNWGSKWDAKDLKCEQIGFNCLLLRFDSAWGPPITLYEYMQEQGYHVFAHGLLPEDGSFWFFSDGELTYVESPAAKACLRAADGTYDRNGKSSWDTDVEEDSDEYAESGDEYADY